MAARLAPQRNFVTITPTTSQSVNQVSTELMASSTTLATVSSSASVVSSGCSTTTVVNGSGGEIITITATPSNSSGVADGHTILHNGSSLQQQMQHAMQQVSIVLIEIAKKKKELC